jgi:hypothetical protein
VRVTGFDDGANQNIKTPLEVTLMLQSNQKIIRHKVGLLNLAEELGNVSKACQMMGLSRDTFYRYRDAVEEGGVEALLEKTRRVSATSAVCQAHDLKDRLPLTQHTLILVERNATALHGQRCGNGNEPQPSSVSSG